jgi:hypothetical protein
MSQFGTLSTWPSPSSSQLLPGTSKLPGSGVQAVPELPDEPPNPLEPKPELPSPLLPPDEKPEPELDEHAAMNANAQLAEIITPRCQREEPRIRDMLAE